MFFAEFLELFDAEAWYVVGSRLGFPYFEANHGNVPPSGLFIYESVFELKMIEKHEEEVILCNTGMMYFLVLLFLGVRIIILHCLRDKFEYPIRNVYLNEA